MQETAKKFKIPWAGESPAGGPLLSVFLLKNVDQDPSDLCKNLCDFYHSILLHFAFNHSRYYYYKDSCNQNFHNTTSEFVLVYMKNSNISK